MVVSCCVCAVLFQSKSNRHVVFMLTYIFMASCLLHSNIHGLWVGPTVEVVRTAYSGETSSTLAANTNAGVHTTYTIWTKLVAGVALIAAINV